MSKTHNRSYSTFKEEGLLRTIHQGFNYFHQINFNLGKKKNYNHTRTFRTNSTISNRDDHKSLQVLLTDNKEKFNRIKTEMSRHRQTELNDYVKKSLKYQEILNINDTKKKRLPTLNTKIGEVIKKSAVEALAKNVQYTIISSSLRLEGWKPESREGHTTTIYKNMAVVIGGHCSFPYSLAQVYSFEKQAWIRKFELLTARSYHSAIFYKNRFIIIFGGMGTYDISRKCRVCYNTINLVDLQTWSSRSLKMNGQETIEGRRNHGAILMGKYMLIIGGINTKRSYLSDFVYLDLKQLRWYHKQYKIEGKQLSDHMESGLAKHKMISHFKSTHKSFPLYSSEYADSEGILIFGGFFGNGEESIVLFLNFNKYNPTLKKLDYSGIPPSSIQPIVQKIHDNLVVILSGELSDRAIKLFRIKQRQFVSILKQINIPFYGGIGSTINKFQDEIFMFFGLAKSGYIGNIHSFRIEERIVESELKKKIEKSIQFEKDNRQFESQSDF